MEETNMRPNTVKVTIYHLKKELARLTAERDALSEKMAKVATELETVEKEFPDDENTEGRWLS